MWVGQGSLWAPRAAGICGQAGGLLSYRCDPNRGGQDRYRKLSAGEGAKTRVLSQAQTRAWA